MEISISGRALLKCGSGSGGKGKPYEAHVRFASDQQYPDLLREP